MVVGIKPPFIVRLRVLGYFSSKIFVLFHYTPPLLSRSRTFDLMFVKDNAPIQSREAKLLWQLTPGPKRFVLKDCKSKPILKFHFVWQYTPPLLSRSKVKGHLCKPILYLTHFYDLLFSLYCHSHWGNQTFYKPLLVNITSQDADQFTRG